MNKILVLFMMLSLNSCNYFADRDPHPMNPIDEEAVKEDIAALANGSQMDDPDSEHRYNTARDDLIKLGSSIESHIIFELKNGRDWAVRLGCIEVLTGIGTKKCLEPIIAALKDQHPMVAQKAMYSLRVFCEHRIVPVKDMPNSAVPPIPKRKENDPIDQDYKIWVKWYTENGKALHKAWETWYHANKGEIQV